MVLLLLAILQKIKILWHFEMFVNTGLYGAGSFEMLPVTGCLDLLWDNKDNFIFGS